MSGAVRFQSAVRALLAVAGALLLLICAAPSASAQVVTLGLGGWQLQSSAQVTAPGAAISTAGFPTAAWLPVKPDDAGAPGTEIGAQLQNGICPEVFYAENLKRCFGYLAQIGPVAPGQFSAPWWFRTEFTTDAGAGAYTQLIINGVVGDANLWVDGTEVSGHRAIKGAFDRYTFDVSSLIHPGANALALEVYPNNPARMFTLDDVDWNQIPPDNNTGLQFPVELHTSGPLALAGLHVSQDDAVDLTSASMTLRGEVTNNTASAQSGIVTASLATPTGESFTLSKPVSVDAHASTQVTFSPAEDPRLTIADPLVWWPYQMGSQPLYRASMGVRQAGVREDSESQTFGIRTVTSRLLGASAIAPDGVRSFAVNGRPVVLRAGGWAEDLFLRYSAAETATQIALIKNLGLNGIRTEGKQMPQAFYEQMDRAGILIDAGFQCCDAWQPEGRKLSREDLAVIQRAAQTIGEELRDHPSVFSFSWSDAPPTPSQERASLDGFAQAEFPDPLIASAEYRSSRQLGPSGEKEGPYAWVPPSYWYDATHYNPRDPTRTNVGGAWGFNSEASAGDTVPTLDSIERFMAPSEQQALWQRPEYHQYHTNYETQLPNANNEGYAFGTLYELDRAIAERYGQWKNLAQYVEEAQVQNYETQRAQFEAYVDHSTAQPTPSTGVVYWQLNKGMPTLLWDLYNKEYDQAGSYFGAQEANHPLHALYSYDTGTVSLDNLAGAPAEAVTVQSKVYSLAGELLDEQSTKPLTVAGQGVEADLIKPRVPPDTAPPAPAQSYFEELLVRQKGRIVDRNVYWLSTQPDVIDWNATVGKAQATMTRYANLQQLSELPPATLAVSASTASQPGPGGGDRLTSVTITNTSTTPAVAFFLRADIRRGAPDGTPAPGDDQVLPVFWSSNDTTLWPGESETLTASYSSAQLQGSQPVVSVSGWNVPTQHVAAP